MSAPEQDPIGQDLDEYLAGPDPDYTAPPEAPQDADQADKRLRRLAKIRAAIARDEEHAASQIEQISAWLDARLSVHRKAERWEQEGLEMWHRAVLAGDPSRKTISLPCGTLKSRVQQPAWEFDDAVFLPWAEVHAPELVKVQVRSSVDRNAAKHAIVVLDDGRHIVSGTGEVVPGVTVTVRPPSFTVVTDEAVA